MQHYRLHERFESYLEPIADSVAPTHVSHVRARHQALSGSIGLLPKKLEAFPTSLSMRVLSPKIHAMAIFE